MVAVFASLLMLLWHGARPYVAFLGRIPGTNRFSDIARHPSNEPTPGMLAFRVQSSLYYFNVDHVLEIVLQRTRQSTDIRRVICDLSNTPYVDVAGARMLGRLFDELTAANVDFKIVEAHGPVREILRAEQLEERVGSITRHGTLAELILKSSPPAHEAQDGPST
jgi:MFS superfamily sulfate permease-like transporter